MKRWNRAAALAAVAISLAFSPLPGAAAGPDAGLLAALAAPHRAAANVARDGWRHPGETLAFLGIEPTMTVVELSPGGGWYTEILAPYLRERGRLVVAGSDPQSPGGQRQQKRFDAEPRVYDRVSVGVLDVKEGRFLLAAPGSADMVLTFRNVHNWVALGEPQTRAVFAAAFAALKPGGVFGVEEHRLPEGREQDAKASSGYVHQAYVVKLAEAAGFRFVAGSEINANPKDRADHEGGVWALPPTYTNKDRDRAKYEAIGESDRMTLKFVKP